MTNPRYIVLKQVTSVEIGAEEDEVRINLNENAVVLKLSRSGEVQAFLRSNPIREIVEIDSLTYPRAVVVKYAGSHYVYFFSPELWSGLLAQLRLLSGEGPTKQLDRAKAGKETGCPGCTYGSGWEHGGDCYLA